MRVLVQTRVKGIIIHYHQNQSPLLTPFCELNFQSQIHAALPNVNLNYVPKSRNGTAIPSFFAPFSGLDPFRKLLSKEFRSGLGL